MTAQELEWKGLRWSIIGHAALILLVIIKSVIFPGKPIVYVPSLRVDLVGLPDILKKDLKELPKGATENQEEENTEEVQPKKSHPLKMKEQAEPAEPDEMVLKPKSPKNAEKNREKKLKSALDRIKALAKISGSDSAPQVMVKGNKVSKGTSLSGDAKESAEASYYDLIRERLQDNWALPIWIARQNLSAQVQIFIDRRGKLHEFKFIRLSGSAQFDEAVKRTIRESQPFPVPPAELSNTLLMNGILIGFPL